MIYRCATSSGFLIHRIDSHTRCSDATGSFVVPIFLLFTLLTDTSRRDCVLGLFDDVLLAISIAHVDVVIAQGLESIHLYRCPGSRLSAARGRWVYVAGCGSTVRVRGNPDPQIEKRPKCRKGAGDDTDAFLRQRPEADLSSGIYEFTRIAVECEVLETNDRCARSTKFMVSQIPQVLKQLSKFLQGGERKHYCNRSFHFGFLHSNQLAKSQWMQTILSRRTIWMFHKRTAGMIDKLKSVRISMAEKNKLTSVFSWRLHVPLASPHKVPIG
jgi:hypothetical protein